MKPLPLPPVDDLLTKLNSAIRGAGFPLSRVFADYDKHNNCYRVAYRVSKGYRRIARLSPSVVKACNVFQLREMIALQCAFKDVETERISG